MQKCMIWLLVGCLLLSGCSGKEQAEQPGEQNVVTAETPEEQPSAEPADPEEPDEFLVESAAPKEPAAVADWQRVYMEFLAEKAAQVVHLRNAQRPDYDPNEVGAEIEAVSGHYALSDIDKDDVPELLFRCQFGWYTEIYGCREGKAVLLGGVHTKDASFYSWPGENALALDWARMGGHTVTKLSVVDGALAEEVIFEEFVPESPYTKMAEIVPGSTCLWENRTFVELPEVSALTLPILHYGKDRTPQPVDAERDEAAKAAIEGVLTGGSPFYGVSADGFGGDTGRTTLEAYLAPGGVTPYHNLPMEVRETVWLDFNGDGQREALLTLRGAEADDYDDTKQVIFAWDGADTVYAYCNNYMDFYDLVGTVFTGKYDMHDFAVDFDGPQFYCYGVEV